MTDNDLTGLEATATDPTEIISIRKAQPAARQLWRVRLEYTCGPELRYVSHLDTQLVWERTLRRAGVPLAYSQGFTPHARLHLASALPVGFLSRFELVDFWLEAPEGEEAALEGLSAQIQAAAPPGLSITRAETVPLNQPALQTQVQAAEYIAAPLDPINQAMLRQQVEALLSQPALLREKRGKIYDLRPLIEALETRTGTRVEGAQGEGALFMRLAAREGATGRPEEVLAALGFDPAAFRVERTGLILG